MSLGERFLTNSGEWCEVIEVLPKRRVRVMWDSDGATSTHTISNLKRKEARNPNFKLYDIEGKTFSSNRGEKYEVIKYYNTNKIIIEWESGEISEIRYDYIKSGHLRDPANKFKGIGRVDRRFPDDRGIYLMWDRMIKRTTGTWDMPTYEEVEIEKELTTYSNFYFTVERLKGFKKKGYHLDKDILSSHLGLKIPSYRRDTLALVPGEINTFFPRRIRDLPCGVEKKGNKYGAATNFRGERHRKGGFSLPEEAFEEYCGMKRSQLNILIRDYEKLLDEEVIEALKEMDLREFFKKG